MHALIDKFLALISLPWVQIIVVSISTGLIAVFFLIRIKEFLSTDPRPKLQYFSAQQRKNELTSAVPVKTGLFIKNFPEFDLIKNEFVLDAIVWFEFNSSLLPIDLIEKFSFFRATALQKSAPEVKGSDGYILVKYNVKVDFSTNLSHQSFPMNEHNIFIVLTNEYTSPNEMLFLIEKASFSWSDRINTGDWTIVGKSAEAGYIEYNFDPSSGDKQSFHPSVIYSLTVHTGLRKAALIFMPMFFMLQLGTFSLILNVKNMAGTVISLAVGSLTGLLAYRFVIENVSPNVGYFTLAERLYNMVLNFTFMTFLIDIIQVSLIENTGMHIPFINAVWLYTMQISLAMLVYSYLYRHTAHYILKLSQMHAERKRLRFKAAKLAFFQAKFTLSNLIVYSNALNEHPSNDNDNWINPDFTLFHRRELSLVASIKKIFRPLPWFYTYFIYLLQDYVQNHKQFADQQHVLSIAFKENSQFIVFGDLYASFHSLVRNLAKLRELDLINDNLELTKKNIFMVFLGNVINQSPYTLETLTLVLTLIRKNPKRVFYIRGNQENKVRWKDSETHRELRLKLKKYYKKSHHELLALMDSLFLSLPIALYINSKDGMLCFTHETTNLNLMTPPKMNYDSQTNGLIGQGDLALPGKEILADRMIFIRGVRYEAFYTPIIPLKLLLQVRGVMTWSLFSAPNTTYQNLANFHEDTFAVLNTYESITQFALSLYCQDCLKLSGYQVSYFHLLYGTKMDSFNPEVGFKYKQEILLGSSLDQFRGLSLTSKRVRNGTITAVIKENSMGGAKDHPLRIIFLDDSYMPHRTLKNAEKYLTCYKTDIIFCPVGSPTVEMLLKLVRLKKIAVFFPFSGSSLFRDPSLGYMVHFRASYADEAEKLVGHAYHSFGVRRFALFYQNDSFGLSALEGAKKALTAKNCEWIEAGYERNTADINPAAEKILKFNSNAILFFSNYAPSVALVHKMGVENLSNQVLMGISVITDAFRDFLHSVGLEMILSQVVPSCYDPSIPIVKEFTEDISRYDYYDSHVTPVTLESYINIAIFSMVLEKIDYPYTKEKILQQFELIKNINFKGLHLDFNPATRSLSNRVWIDRGYSEPWMTD